MLSVVMGVTVNVGMAQEAGNVSTTEIDDYDSIVGDISSTTTLTNYEFDENNETVTLWFDAVIKERVTLTDAYIEAGKDFQEVNQRKPYINGKQKVVFGVSKISGKMGVTVDAGDGLKAITWQEPGFQFSSTYTAQQMIVGMIFASGLGILLVLVVAYKRQVEYNSKIKQVW